MKEEKELEENGGKPKEVVYGKVSKKLSFDDQTRQLHEAYQFLIKRYKLQEDIGHYAERVQALEKQQKRLEKMAIQAENNKNEEMENSEDHKSLHAMIINSKLDQDFNYVKPLTG